MESAGNTPQPASPYVASEVATGRAATYPSPPPRRPRWGLRILLGGVVLGLLCIGGMILVGIAGMFTADPDHYVKEKHHSLERLAPHKIAIIRVEGTIMDGEGFVKDQIDQVRRDMNVKAVVLRIDSPGGTVTGSDYIYHHLNKLRTERNLPIVVSMGGMAASGGYYVAMAVGDEKNVIYAEPTTWTGSIGVIIPHYTVAGLMKRFEVQDDSIKSHPLKAMGSPTKEMTEEERNIFQGLVDDSFARFKEIVKTGRPKFKDIPDSAEKGLNKYATGQVFTTHQALEIGLVDKEGFLEDAIDRALELKNLTRANTEAIEYERPFSLFGGLLSAKASEHKSDLKMLFDLATPRAFYLMAWPTE